MEYLEMLGIEAIVQFNAQPGESLKLLTHEDLELIGQINFLERDPRVKSVEINGFLTYYKITVWGYRGINDALRILSDHCFPERHYIDREEGNPFIQLRTPKNTYVLRFEDGGSKPSNPPVDKLPLPPNHKP